AIRELAPLSPAVLATGRALLALSPEGPRPAADRPGGDAHRRPGRARHHAQLLERALLQRARAAAFRSLPVADRRVPGHRRRKRAGHEPAPAVQAPPADRLARLADHRDAPSLDDGRTALPACPDTR